MTEEKLLIVTQIGPEDPENCLFPFIVANAALLMDIEVTVFMMGKSVELAVKGAAEKVPHIEKMPNMEDMMKTFSEFGGNMKLCGPCCAHRDITGEDLLPNAEVGGASMLVDMVMGRKTISF